MKNLNLKAISLGITNVLSRDEMKNTLGGFIGTRCPSGCSVTTIDSNGRTVTKAATCTLSSVTGQDNQVMFYCDCNGGSGSTTCAGPVTDPVS